ncbi:MAG: DUF3617 family protein [Phenylobacterium sp.]|nr:MAG: DUF3617 family protein [Phenylobacterium sp.]
MMRRIIPAPASRRPPGLPASGAACAAPQAMQPGMWEETRKPTMLVSPAMSPAMMDAMRWRPLITSRRCITTQPAKGDGWHHEEGLRLPRRRSFQPRRRLRRYCGLP